MSTERYDRLASDALKNVGVEVIDFNRLGAHLSPPVRGGTGFPKHENVGSRRVCNIIVPDAHFTPGQPTAIDKDGRRWFRVEKITWNGEQKPRVFKVRESRLYTPHRGVKIDIQSEYEDWQDEAEVTISIQGDGISFMVNRTGIGI